MWKEPSTMQKQVTKFDQELVNPKFNETNYFTDSAFEDWCNLDDNECVPSETEFKGHRQDYLEDLIVEDIQI
jgi:hypothetical protein